MPVDGTWPAGTASWEKRNIAETVPVWHEDLCVQCGQCSFVCPHGVIQARYFDAARLEKAPAGFKSRSTSRLHRSTSQFPTTAQASRKPIEVPDDLNDVTHIVRSDREPWAGCDGTFDEQARGRSLHCDRRS